MSTAPPELHLDAVDDQRGWNLMRRRDGVADRLSRCGYAPLTFAAYAEQAHAPTAVIRHRPASPGITAPPPTGVCGIKRRPKGVRLIPVNLGKLIGVLPVLAMSRRIRRLVNEI
jgi:hypothetical protein